MKTFLFRMAVRLQNDLRGQDLVEYALMAGFVAVAAGATFPATVMPGVSTIFSRIQSSMTLAGS
jgi:pilus assembly protein Flp/PilA